jgi:hypothetical protein
MLKVSINPGCCRRKKHDEPVDLPTFDVVVPPPLVQNRNSQEMPPPPVQNPVSQVVSPRAANAPSPSDLDPAPEPEGPATPPNSPIQVSDSPTSVADFEVIDT